MKIAIFALGVAFIATFGLIFSRAIRAQEHQECVRWMYEAEGRAAWYSTEWQQAQCRVYGITLPDAAKYMERLKEEAPDWQK